MLSANNEERLHQLQNSEKEKMRSNHRHTLVCSTETKQEDRVFHPGGESRVAALST